MELWPDDNMDIYAIRDNNFVKQIAWKKRLADDHYELSKKYNQMGVEVFEKILDDSSDHIKTDMWFYVGIALLRQSIELILKALVCKIYPENIHGNKKKIQECFVHAKHNLVDIYNECANSTDVKNCLTAIENKWISEYLKTVEIDDRNSDIFRFPFDKEFFAKYRNKYIDVKKTEENLLAAYYLIEKCYQGTSASISLPNNNGYLVEASSGMNDCYMWDDSLGDGYYKHIIGYSEVIEYLLGTLDNADYFYCFMFLYRNLLELILKKIYKLGCKLSQSRVHIVIHSIKDIWGKILENCHEDEKNDQLFNIVGRELIKIHNIDKKGDAFRYPTNYSFQYCLDGYKFDVNNTIKCYKMLYNFLSSFIYKLEEEEEYFDEMIREYY